MSTVQTLRAAAVTFLPLAVVCCALVSASASQTVHVAPGWTPFEADFERVDNHSGSVETRGRIYVDAMGSERRESWVTTSGRQRRVVEIRNQSLARFCRGRAETDEDGTAVSSSWTCQPMDILPAPPRPARSEAGPMVEGYSTVVFRASSGVELVMSPELSYYTIIRRDPSLTMRLFNIIRRSPPAELFFPPGGAHIRELTEKGGRVTVSDTQPK